ncbi:MAG: hypothetical protein KKB25_01710, partial [Nanoarchaeota archaeon]|nr:hypothetical protein [Nanoarchaeota archaeon]
MKTVLTIFLAAMLLTAFSGNVVAQEMNAATSSANIITDFSNNKITIDSVKTDLSSKYAAGTL